MTCCGHHSAPRITHSLVHSNPLTIASGGIDSFEVTQFENTMQYTKKPMLGTSAVFAETVTFFGDSRSAVPLPRRGTGLVDRGEEYGAERPRRNIVRADGGRRVPRPVLHPGAQRGHPDDGRAASPITATSISGEYCVVGMENHHCVLFITDLQVLVEQDINHVVGCALCNEHGVLAVATDQHQLVAHAVWTGPVPLEYGSAADGESDFNGVSTCDGRTLCEDAQWTLMKWGMDESNFSHDCATLFQSDGKPVIVEQFRDFALIVADRVF
jgi:hypothetical protein